MKCSSCGHETDWLCGFDRKVEREKTEECPECKAVATLRQTFDKAPVVFYNGDGWTNAWSQRSQSKGSKSQAELDAALRENDSLSNRQKERNYQKASDAIKRAEDENL